MDNYDVAHKFFYDMDGYFKKHYINVWYDNYKFYSYGTIIGKVIEDKDGNFLLLVSENNFSNTTCKHISNLLGACPFNNRLFVPIAMYDRDININELEKIICKKLDVYKNSKLSLKENREKYIHYYNMLQSVNDKVIKVKKSVFNKYSKLYEDLKDIEKVKSIKKAENIKNRKENEKINKEFEKLIKEKNLDELKAYITIRNCELKLYKLLKNYITEKTVENLIKDKNLLDIINLAFNSNLNWQEKNDIKNYLYKNYKYDYVWIDGENFKTSKNISVKIEDCKPLIRLYQSGKAKHGLKLNQYTILEITKEFVKIGCHKIPVENINCLIENL
jgi:hypothetical protein